MISFPVISRFCLDSMISPEIQAKSKAEARSKKIAAKSENRNIENNPSNIENNPSKIENPSKVLKPQENEIIGFLLIAAKPEKQPKA